MIPTALSASFARVIAGDLRYVVSLNSATNFAAVVPPGKANEPRQGSRLHSRALLVPEPMAIPTLASTRAGASLIPSPTIATLRPFPRSSLTHLAFCSFNTSPTASSTPSFRPTELVTACITAVPGNITPTKPRTHGRRCRVDTQSKSFSEEIAQA